MSNTKHFTDSLSAYIDGALNPVERTRVDAHLATCPQCRADLDELRYVATMTRALPLVHAPRSFTLTPEMVARRAHSWQFGWLYASLRGLTAVAAVLLVFVCSADFLSGSRLGGSGASAPVPAVMSLPESTQANPATADQATNQSKSPSTAAPAAPAGAAPAATAASAPNQTPHAPLPAQAASGTEGPNTRAAGAASGTPVGTARSASVATTATAAPTVTVTPAPVVSPSSPLTVTGPAFPTVPLPVPTTAAEGTSQPLPFRQAETGLLGALLVCGIGAVLLRAARR